MKRFAQLSLAMMLSGVLALTGCSTMQLGSGGSMASGSAGAAGTQGESKELRKCSAPIATVALAEHQEGYGLLVQYGLPNSPLPLVRLIMQQTGCFRVVDRSAGLRATQQELALQQQGMTRNSHGIKKGKVLEARYTIAPHVTFSEQNAGGAAGLLGFIPGGALAGAALGSLRFREAEVVMFLTDNETTEQVAAATGSAKATDIGAGGALLGGLGAAVGGAWSKTSEGKVVTAALIDGVNKLVPHIEQLRKARN